MSAQTQFTSHTIGTTGGSFQASTDLADLDGDGHLDFMVGYRQGGRELFWFEYRGASDWVRHKIGGNNTDVGGDACDLDGDGDIDAVAGALWFENTGGASFTSGGLPGGDGNAHDTVCADINSDGVLDVVSMSDRATTWFEHDGDFGFTKHGIGHGEHGGVAPMGARDLDGDGDVDVTSVKGWFENLDGGQNWEFHDDFYEGNFGAPYGDMIRSWAVDLDRDGDVDVVTTVGDLGSGALDWWENRGGAQRFQKHEIDHNVGDLHSLAVADFDNDGDWDVFSCEGPLGGDRAMLWFNEGGAGGSWSRSTVHSGEECHEGVVGDVDGDGDVDVAFKPWNRGESVYLENQLDQGGGLGVADGAEAESGGDSSAGGQGSVAEDCNVVRSGVALPEGFAAPYNVLSASQELLVSVSCMPHGAELVVGAGDTSQYVYALAYAWRNGQWEQVALTGDTPAGDQWYVGGARAELPHTAAELPGNNFIVAYICTLTGGAWKCGCRDAACAQSLWQLQVFKR